MKPAANDPSSGAASSPRAGSAPGGVRTPSPRRQRARRAGSEEDDAGEIAVGSGAANSSAESATSGSASESEKEAGARVVVATAVAAAAAREAAARVANEGPGAAALEHQGDGYLSAQILVAAITQARRAMDAETSGPDALTMVLRSVCGGLSKVTSALVLQQLQNFAVPAGTTFKAYLEELKVLVESVQLVGFAEDGTLQVAVKAGVTDQFATLTAPVFHGRNTQALPYDNLDDLMAALEDMIENTTTATSSTRVRGIGNGTKPGVTLGQDV
ncbi:unnamed protein product [Ectocarpus sp. CCAP 1310/34]|nr:unnamed protein product [Ectocarpus sp. CCAP 1310/34]